MLRTGGARRARLRPRLHRGPPSASRPQGPPSPTEECDAVTVYDDGDGDGYGAPSTAHVVCEPAPDEVLEAGDCDDTDGLARDGAPDLACDGSDSDCDGLTPQCERSLRDDAGAYLTGWSQEHPIGLGATFVGDLDHDGRDDLVVGGGGTTWEYTGAYLLAGATLPGATGPVEPLVRATFRGDPTIELAPSKVLPAGDVHGDGVLDYWIGPPFRLMSGMPEGEVSHAAASAAIPTIGVADTIFPASSADADADGRADLLFTTARYDIYLFTAPFAPVSGAADATLHVTTDRSSDVYAQGAADAADVDGDGVAELFLGTNCGGGATSFGDNVAVAVADGTTTGTLVLSDRAAMEAWIECRGRHSADVYEARTVGDVNGDGYGDLGIARSYEWSVVPGPLMGEVDPTTDAVLVVTSEIDGEHLTLGAPGSAGDIDGDGRDEVYQQIYGTGQDGDWKVDGALHVVRGARSGVIGPEQSDAVWAGQASDSAIGWIVTGGGDADGDALPDLLVSVFDYSPQDPHAGHVYWLPGASLLDGPP